jgi:hypothetical protein
MTNVATLEEALAKIAATNEKTRTNERTGAKLPAADPAMFRGVLGEITEAAEPTSEADPVGVFTSLLASVGVVIGSDPFVQVGNTKHPLLIWPLLFGRTGSGRKGEATDTALTFVRTAVADSGSFFVTGLSSGEGLIERIRDVRDEKDQGGTDDKRLFLVEPEFASVMSRAKREGSSLGHVLREAWSGKSLATLNRSATTASWSHVAVLGHITPKEFRLKLSAEDMSGGTYNRFLPVYVERSKRLPIPDGVAPEVVDALAADLRKAIARAKALKRIRMNIDAAKLWTDELYDELTEADDEDEAWTEFARRGAPYALRIAALHAALDGRPLITGDDLRAAVALVRYSIGSAKFVLDGTKRNPRLDRVARALDSAGESGLSRKEISALFSRNLDAVALNALLDELSRGGDYLSYQRTTGGRPAEMWRRAPKTGP